MKKNNRTCKDYIVAIDVGTTKICVLIAEKITADQCTIIGIGRTPSLGLERGVIVDVGPAIQTIKAAIQEAELMAGCSIESAYIGISGSHIKAYNSTGMIPIKHGDIRETDIQKVLAAAQAIPLPEGEQILHAVPQYFTIDGHHRVKDPIGMHGVRLEAQVHIVTGGVTSVQNLVRCCEAAGVKVRDIVLEPIASAQAVLTPDEKELGVGMIDIGGGTSDFAVYQRNAIRHTKIIPIAGNLFTKDLTLCLRTTRAEAERVKKEFGTTELLATHMHPENKHFEIISVDGEQKRIVSVRDIAAIIQPRAQELLLLVHHELTKFRLLPFMPSGLVLTGGGSQLKHLAVLAEQILGIPTRIGKPRVSANFREELDNPLYATGYGLVLYAIKKEQKDLLSNLSGPLVSRLFWKMKSWIGDFF